MGGLQNHAQEFNRHLAAAGYEIAVFTPRIPATAPEQEHEGSNVRVIRFPAFEPVANWPVPKVWHPRFWMLLRLLYRTPTNLVIARTRFFLTTWLALLYARLRRRPYVHIEHGADYPQFRRPLMMHIGRLLDHTLGALVLQSAHQVVANSEKTATFVTKIVPGVAVKVIYRGVEIEEIDRIIPAAPVSSPSRKIRIGYFGRLIAGKGVADLLQALTSLPAGAWEAIIVGHGSDAAYLAKTAQTLDLTDVVTFLQPDTWREAIALLKTVDIVVNPSYTEGMPTIVIEAALCGKAIVATNVGGTPEIIRDRVSGRLVPARDVAALGAALQELLRQPHLRRQWGEQASHDARAKFTWSRAAAAYEDILVTLLS